MEALTPLSSNKPTLNSSSQTCNPGASDSSKQLIKQRPSAPSGFLSIPVHPLTERATRQLLSDYFSNNCDIAIAVTKLFMDEVLPETLQGSYLLLEEGMTQFAARVHKWKPSFGMIGQPELSEFLSGIEADCRQPKKAAAVQKKVQAFETAMLTLQQVLTNQLSFIEKLKQ